MCILPISLFTLGEVPLPELLDPIEQVILAIVLSKTLCFSEKENLFINDDSKLLLMFLGKNTTLSKILLSSITFHLLLDFIYSSNISVNILRGFPNVINHYKKTCMIVQFVIKTICNLLKCFLKLI